MIRLFLSALLLAGLGLPGQTSTSPVKSVGRPLSPITIEVYSDFQCPACKALHEQTLKPLIADYVNTGKVYLQHRDFPLPMHQYARLAASYAVAAGHVGKYEEVGDALFARQETWSKDGSVAQTVMAVLTPAEAKKVQALAPTPQIAADIDQDVQKGRAAGLQQTPTMILSHKAKTYPISGVVTYPILRRFLDQLLAQ
jgi:protein-disulfide isomerase